MGCLVIFQACFVAIEGAVADLAMVVDVYVRVAVAARDDYARLLFFSQIETCYHLKYFY